MTRRKDPTARKPVLGALLASFAVAATAAPAQALAQAAAAAPTPDKGDVAWMLVSTLLVLLMILPGLALFYGGLVRVRNMVSMLAQVTAVTAVGMLIWALWGYSLAFTDGGPLDLFVGGFSRAFLLGVTPASTVATFSPGVVLPEYVFVMFQATFACITAALVLGGVAERKKFTAVLLFAVLWPTLVYYPVAHMVWWQPGPDALSADPHGPVRAGLLWKFGALDFAGGTVVHVNAGVAALIGAIVLGRRNGYRREPTPPHSLTLMLTGAALLWVGWFGFNAGSNLEANGFAALAMANTFFATAAAALSWMGVEWVTRKKPTLLGLASGAVAGLVVVTPAAGFAGPMGAIVLGAIVSPICIAFCSSVKSALGYDDSLDAFGIHGVGGMVGAVGTAFVVNPAWGGAGLIDYTACANGVCPAAPFHLGAQLLAQIKAVAVTVLWSGVGSTAVFFAIKAATGGRVSTEIELEGLDFAEHGEAAYHL